VVLDTPLNEIQRPFAFVAFLTELHLLPLGGMFVDPDFVEKMHRDGVEEEIPILADRIAEVNWHRLPPCLGSICELQGSHSPEINNHLG
jgi:hypothetical protein